MTTSRRKFMKTGALAGAVDHDRTEAHHRLDTKPAGDLGAGFHHQRRPDGDDLVDIAMPVDGALDPVADDALDAGRAIVRTQDQFVADRFELLLPENQALGTKPKHADDVGTILFEATRLRENRGNAQPSANADDLL